IAYRAARSDTDGVSVSDRAKMSRRVPSAKARKSWLSACSLPFLRTTIWLYINLTRSLLQGVFRDVRSLGWQHVEDLDGHVLRFGSEPVLDTKDLLRAKAAASRVCSGRALMPAKLRVLVSRHSAFYTPLIATLAGDFLAEQDLEAGYGVL